MAGPTRVIGAVVMLAAACGGSSTSSQMPAQNAARAQAAIRTASAAGAERDPRAAMYLQFAKQSASAGHKLEQSGDEASAKLLLDDAKADADLSFALTKRREAEVQCQQAKQRLEDKP